MSIQSYEEAIDRVLSAEFAAQDDMILMRAGAYPALEQDAREFCLPREIEQFSLSLALGAAQAGCFVVLDLRSASEASLIDAIQTLPEHCPRMTILTNVTPDGAPKGSRFMRRFLPQTPREAAGFMRAALRMRETALLALDKSKYGEREDVPDDEEFVLLPEEEEKLDLSQPAEETDEAPIDAAPSEETDEAPIDAAPAEEEDAPEIACTACDETETEPPLPAQAPQAEAICLSARSIPFDAQALTTLCLQLGAPAEYIQRLCLDRLREQCALPFEWINDSEALPGECAHLAPEQAAALLWVGADVMTITYDAKRLSHADAAHLLRDAQRLLQNPLLLLYDKERC